MKKLRRKNRQKLHPIMIYVLLIFGVIILSGILHLFDVQSTYYTINATTLTKIPVTETVNSLFSLSGIKYIFSNTVANFANFAVLSNLIILLMGISIMDKSGFLQTAITLTTKKMKKKTVTFIFVLVCVLSSLFGDLSYLIFIPLGALLFFYGKRNPAIGIITSFAAISCGSGLNILFTSVDSSLLTFTNTAAKTLNGGYASNSYPFIFIMAVSVLLVSYIITLVTENIIAKKVPKYEFTELELEEDIVTKNEKKGMIYACLAALVYLVFFFYNIIPGLPLSGAFLDNSQVLYVDKLFSVNAFFSHGFIFIITMLFIILGLFFGIGAKSIKNHHDFCDNLGHSLDGIGNVLVMVFLASIFISIFKQTNIGNVIVAAIGNFIEGTKLSGLPLIVITFIGIAISTILVPSSTLRWYILCPTLVPLFMASELSPEFTQIVFRFSESITMNITPILAYFIVYLAFLEKYNQSDGKIGMKEAFRYQLPYTFLVGVTLFVIILVWYMVGLPLGNNTFPVL